MIHSQKAEFCPNVQPNIVLVSDDSPLKTAVLAFLDEAGYGCTSTSCADLRSVFARQTFDAVILDTDQAETVSEVALEIIRESRAALWTRILTISSEITPASIRDFIDRHNFRRTSRANLQPELLAALQDMANQSVSKATFHSMQTAELRFDSSRGYLTDGFRGFRTNCRQLIFQHRASIVDLLIEPREDSGRIAITGQVMDSPKTEDVGRSTPVLLVSGIRTMSRTATNPLGEFSFDSTPLQEACVEIRLREGAWVSLNLGKLDWAIQ